MLPCAHIDSQGCKRNKKEVSTLHAGVGGVRTKPKVEGIMMSRCNVTEMVKKCVLQNMIQSSIVVVTLCLVCPMAIGSPDTEVAVAAEAPVMSDTNQELYRLMFEGNVIDAVQYQHALEHGRLPGNGALPNAAIPAERQTTWNSLHSQGVISAEELVQILGEGKIGDLSETDLKAFEELAPVYEPNHAKRLKYEVRKKHIAVDMIRFRQTTGKKWTRWKEEADERAKLEGIPIRFGGLVLVRFDERGLPVYITHLNKNAADSIWCDEIRPGGSSPFGLTGSNITVAVFDAGLIRDTHQEFVGRVKSAGTNMFFLGYHSTAVAGTVGAYGVETNAMGMAPASNVDVYDSSYPAPLDVLPAIIQTNPLCQISNHSYGRAIGWHHIGTNDYWLGDKSISTNEDIAFGQYTTKSRAIDELCYDAKYHLPVYAAGNNGEPEGLYWYVQEHLCQNAQGVYTTHTDSHAPDGDYMYTDTLSPYSTPKNGMIVGSAIDAIGGYTTNTPGAYGWYPENPPSEWRSNYSSQGLTDDLRAKPDILANGEMIYTTDSDADDDYVSYPPGKSGTSFSAPCVSGSLALLQELHQRIYGTNAPMLASTLKAIALHTAVNRNPDYSHSFAEGWGVMNTLAAAWVISNNAAWASMPHVKEVALQDGDMIEFRSQATDTNMLLFTVVWTDPEGPIPPYTLDATNSVLVNDLDLRVYAPDGTTNYPYVYVEDTTNVNLSFKQVRADNDRDNVERIYIADPTNGWYTVQVTHKGALSNGVQDVSIVVTGNTPTNAPDFKISKIMNSTSEDMVQLEWPGVVGGLYEVQSLTNLMDSPSGWTPIGQTLSSYQPTNIWTNAVSEGEPQFFRIERLK